MVDAAISCHAVGIVQVAAYGGCETAVSERIEALQHGADIIEIGPRRWWLIAREGEDRSAVSFDPDEAAIVDLSSSRLVLRLRHARWREVVAKGCGIDLSSARFARDAYAATAFARFNVLLRAPRGVEGCDLYVARSCVQALHHWLEDALVEFGDS